MCIYKYKIASQDLKTLDIQIDCFFRWAAGFAISIESHGLIRSDMIFW